MTIVRSCLPHGTRHRYKSFLTALRMRRRGIPGNFAAFLPAFIFFVATVLAFSTGTAWGTFGILIPIVVNVFPAENELLYVGISACLAGAVCGDHCSPISDTTIMSSAGAQCRHLSHVSTQLPYALTAAGFSFAGYLLAGVICNWYIVFPLTFLLMLGFLVLFKVFQSRRASSLSSGH